MTREWAVTASERFHDSVLFIMVVIPDHTRTVPMLDDMRTLLEENNLEFPGWGHGPQELLPRAKRQQVQETS